MTTLAMGAGMMPIALGFSGDSSFRAPMAIAVIGGLITSTLLSLIVIPAAFTVIDDLGEWVSTKFHRRPPHPVPDSSGGGAHRHPLLQERLQPRALPASHPLAPRFRGDVQPRSAVGRANDPATPHKIRQGPRHPPRTT